MWNPGRARRLTLALILAALAASAAVGATVARGDSSVVLPVTHEEWNVFDALASDGDGTTTPGASSLGGAGLCATSPSSAANVNTDCTEAGSTVGIHNETSIAVNPTNPQNLIAGANDYQLTINGGSLYESVLSRAHVSFDGGKSWTTYAIDDNSYNGTGDPALAFDATGRAYYATLADVFGQQGLTGTNPDILVNTSTDGGRTWTGTRVASGSGANNSVGDFLDKEWISAWGDGHAIVTFTDFQDGIGGSYGGSPIYDSVTADGGKTWTTPAEISGSAPFCVGFGGGTACNQDQGSVPAVAADGSVYVTFFSTADAGPNFRDQYLVVKVDPTTGKRIGGPYRVGTVYDGVTDYPYNVDGRPTYQDSEFRTWAAGNIAADPTNAKHLAVIWSDMRNSQLPAPSDPYQAKTNSDVIVSQSTDGGQTWSKPTAIKTFNDQFMPWGAYGSDGLLRIGYFDRSYDPANHKYGYTLATESRPASLSFSARQLTNTLSDPTQNDRWFSGATASLGYPTRFLGDYSGLSSDATTALWTDLRNPVNFAGRSGTTEDAYYASTR